MKFEKHFPSDLLKDYIRYYVVSENDLQHEYKVFPTTALVIGFQYRGRLSTVEENGTSPLASAGITGISDQYKLFSHSAGIGTILVYFTETGFAHFTSHPANELFGLSIALEEIFDKHSVAETEEKLTSALSDQQRIAIVERFFLKQLKAIQADKLIIEAVKLIYNSKGAIRIKELQRQLFISQSPFEKRFRNIVGTTPKKFASIVRFNTVLDQLNNARSLSDICYENNFFDHPHLIKNFKQFTGETPDQFKRFL